jgi:hypothetical protein
MHADLGQATAREMPVAPMGPEGVGEGGKMVPLPRPWGVLRNGDVEEHGAAARWLPRKRAACGDGRRVGSRGRGWW